MPVKVSSLELSNLVVNMAVGDSGATGLKRGGRKLLVQLQAYLPMKPEEIAAKTSVAANDAA
jgi:hypothetical protein